ncbi:MAG: ABC transporter permease [Myxococcota bacterium]
MKTWVVMRNEIVTTLRDRRAVLSAILFAPLMGPVLFATIATVAVSSASDELTEDIEVAVVGSTNAPNLVTFLGTSGIAATPIGGDRVEERVEEGEIPLALVIPDDAGELLRAGQPMRIEIVSDSSDTTSRGKVRRLRTSLERWSATLTQQRLVARGIPPLVVTPVVIDEIDVSTPGGRALLLLNTLTYFLVFATLFGGMYIAIDATAGERERGSLEPLLILPVSRASIVLGKVGATALFMAGTSFLTLIAFACIMPLVPLDELGMSVDLSPRPVLGMGVALIPFAAFGAAVTNLVSAFTKSYKEAQSYMSIALLVQTLPIMFAGLLGVRTSAALLCVPALSQHLIITGLVKGDPVPLAHYAIAWAANFALAGVLTWFIVRRYRTEALLG